MGDIATASALLAAVVYSLLNLVSFVTAGEWAAAGKIVLSYAVGVGALFLFAASSIGASIAVYGTTLGALNGFDKVILGLVAPSIGGIVYNVKQAIDNTDSASVPKLGGPSA